jgi:ribA/ribD-fused uncharacterized protein
MAIDSFSGDFEFLSNFYDKMVYYNGLYYATSEHAYQTAKTIIPGEMDLVRNCRTPGQAKRMASKKKEKITLRPGWNDMRYDVMLEIVRSKFKDPDLRQKLIDTFPVPLVEGNTWHDNFWGNCICLDCKNKEGHNWLGFILMTVRGELMAEVFKK